MIEQLVRLVSHVESEAHKLALDGPPTTSDDAIMAVEDGAAAVCTGLARLREAIA